MSYTESLRLQRLQETIRVCTVNDAITKMRCSAKDPYGNSTAAGYGNSESGKISKIVNSSQPSGLCFLAPATTDICNPYTAPQTSSLQTIQAESQYIKKIQAEAIACGPPIVGPYVSPTTGQINRISAGGVQESIRIQRMRDGIEYVDYATNPNARLLPYQRFFPAPCPPAPIANNLPLTQPRFPCAPNVVGFT